MSEQIGLHKIKLTQKRYASGAFYLSVVLDAEQVKALDGRFYVEEGDELTPTKNGFRIPVEKMRAFEMALSGDLREIDDIVLYENNSFKFHIQYVNDKYGEGIDLRKYKTTDKYTGWDRSGIRMKLEDIDKIYGWLVDFDHRDVDRLTNIFSGKRIGSRDRANEKDRTISETDINPRIREIMDFE